MTHDKIKALDVLIAAVEVNIWYGDMSQIFGHDKHMKAYKAFCGSLDASKALHEELLPDLLWEITPLGNVYIRDIEYNQLSRAFVTSSPARAWLIAILKAYRAQMEAS